MTQDTGPGELIDCAPDERLLGEEIANLPVGVGRPAPIPPSRARRRIVGVGAVLTGATLLIGIALMVLGAVDGIAGGFGALDIVALGVGLVLVVTHWGWVHVAEATADGVEARHNRETAVARQRWLEAIEPYTRYEVTTSVGEDGSISIVRVRYQPVRRGEKTFTFVREAADSEVHSGDEPGAAVAERAELLRRQAAVDTERERERYEAVAQAYEIALLNHSDEAQRRRAMRAASEALSEGINSNLRDPPLAE